MGLHLAKLVVLLSLFQLLTFSFSSAQQLCHGHEQLALFQFKESFVVEKNASSADQLCVHPKTDRWNVVVDCCTWEGIECDKKTGHVIGLNLSKNCLHGPINSSSSLFRLVHLEKLSLAYNNFSYSEIPPALGSFPRLTYLNLSNASFSGQIPSEILKLSSLSTLDLSLNFAPHNPYEGSLELKRPDLESLANLSSLTSFLCHNCKLPGTFPTSVFQLPRLELLELSKNKGLAGHLPEFYSGNRLKKLSIWNTSFSGELPASIGKLNSLELLGVSNSSSQDRCHLH